MAGESTDQTIRKRFLVTGHPRSGTAYMSALMRACGLDVGHERMRGDGISAWQFAVDCDSVSHHRRPRGRRRYRFDSLIQVVRDPIQTLRSVLYTEDCSRRSLAFRSRFVSIPTDSPSDAAATSIVGWNRLISEQDPALVVRVEEAPGELARFLGVPVPAELPRVDVNSRPHPPLTWRQFKRRSARSSYEALVQHAREYGYRCSDV